MYPHLLDYLSYIAHLIIKIIWPVTQYRQYLPLSNSRIRSGLATLAIYREHFTLQ